MSPRWSRLSLPLRYAWRNAWAHRGATAATLFGVAISVMVYVVMGATADSLKGIAASTGDPANAIALSKGASSAESSRLDAPTANAVRFAPGVLRDASGEPLASVELLAMRRIPIPGLPPDDPASQRFMSLRGVTPAALLVHPGVRIIAGRFPAASGELLIGRLVTENLGAIGIGSEVSIEGRPHRVVGVLGAEGQFFESELWMTLEDLRGKSGDREASAVVLRTSGPAAAAALVDTLEKSRSVNVSAKTEPEYYAQMQRASTAFVYLGNLIGGLLGLGAVVAGANTMYATMSRRIREMGTLRALGFGRWRVGASLLLESTMVSLLGGAIGVLLALAWNGVAFSIVSLSFELAIGPANAARGMAMALAIGAAGGFLPARSASRLEIVAALRHV
ncbi:MAG: ABC transporter permease [Deltaproteobacteria bacterium]|nr:MAG: ABC transporter permease [Deltaproteobacteria bacterium]